MTDSTRHRWRRVAMAGHTGDAAVARAALASDDPVERQLGLGALDRLGQLDHPLLRVAVADPDAGVRRRAVELAATRPGFDLAHALRDPDPTVAEQAAWSCGEQVAVTDEVLEQLIDLARHHQVSLVRESAVAALGAIGDERGLAAVLAGCRDVATVRRRAVLALAPFDGPEVEAALQAALTDRDWQVRQAAEDLGTSELNSP